MKSRDFQARIDAAREDGWRVAEDGTDRVVLKRPSYGSRLGHLLVGVTTVWWSFGLGNLAYAVYEYIQHTERKVLYSEAADEDPMATLRRRYARGEIDEAELERRAERLIVSESTAGVESDSDLDPDTGVEFDSEDPKRGTRSDPDTRLARLRERLR